MRLRKLILSTLAALAQTSLSLIHSKRGLEAAEQSQMMRQSRIAVVLWGVALVLCAIGLQFIRGELNLISLAFGMVTYTYGPLLGGFLLALSPLRRSIRGVWIGAILSILLTLYIRPDLYNLLASLGIFSAETATELRPKLSFAWLYPITCFLTFGCGVLFGRRTGSKLPSAP